MGLGFLNVALGIPEPKAELYAPTAPDWVHLVELKGFSEEIIVLIFIVTREAVGCLGIGELRGTVPGAGPGAP